MSIEFRQRKFRAMTEAELTSWLRAAPVFEDHLYQQREARSQRAAIRRRWPAGLEAEMFEDDERGAEQGGLSGLAAMASTVAGIHAIVSGFDVVTHGLLRAALWMDGTIDRATALRLMPGTPPEEIDASAQRMDDSLLGEHRAASQPWLTLLADVVANIRAPGVSLRGYVDGLTSEELAPILKNLGVSPIPSLKHERIARFAEALADRETVQRGLSSTPEPSQAVFWRLVEHVEPASAEAVGARYFGSFGSLRYSSPGRTGSELEPLARLGLVFGDIRSHVVWAWRETIRAFPERMRRYRFIADHHRASGRVRPIADSGAVSSFARDFDRVVDAWQLDPPPALNDGGIGVAPVRSLAKKLALSPARVGVITNLAVRQNLLDREVLRMEGRGRNRKPVYAWKVVDADLAPTLAPLHRWGAAVSWWMTAPLLNEWNGPPERLCSEHGPEDLALARLIFVRWLLASEPGQGVDDEDLAVSLWRAHPSVFGPALVDGMVAVARAIGLVPADGPVGLTSAARALLSRRFEDIDSGSEVQFVVQADGTIVAPTDLRHDISAELAAISDVESEGGARVLRLTEATIARALDQGRRAADIEQFLTAHAAKGVPQNVLYLLHDLERRRAQLVVVSAATIVVSDDPALVAQAIRVPAAKLRSIGSHAAASSLPAAKVQAALKAKGVFGVSIAETGDPKPTPGTSRADGARRETRSTGPASDAAQLQALGAQLSQSLGRIDEAATRSLARSLRRGERS